MKYRFLLFALMAVAIVACKKNNDVVPVTSVDWVATENVDQSQSMTLIIEPQGEMMSVVDTLQDKVAVFLDQTCLAVSPITSLEIGYRVYFLIYSPSSTALSQQPITIRYFSKAKGAIYDAPTSITFVTDKNIGTTDEPYSILF